MTAEEDHDILIEVRTDVKYLITSTDELKLEVHGPDGLHKRIEKLENNQSKFIGAIAALGAFMGFIGNRLSIIFFGGS